MSKVQDYRKRADAIAAQPDSKPTFLDSPMTGLVLVCGMIVIGVSVWFVGLK